MSILRHLLINLKSHKVHRYPCGPYLRSMECEEAKYHCTRALLLGQLCVHYVQLFCYDRIFRLYVLLFFFPAAYGIYPFLSQNSSLHCSYRGLCHSPAQWVSVIYQFHTVSDVRRGWVSSVIFYNKTEDLCELAMLALMIYPTFQTC